MRTNATKQIRALLHMRPDGLTTKEIAEQAKRNRTNTGKLLRNMPDAYIDRWIKGKRGQYEAVWCAVIPPADCPHPKWQGAGGNSSPGRAK